MSIRRGAALATAFLLTALPAWGAVLFDNADFVHGSSVTSLSFSFTVGSGANRAAIMCLGGDFAGKTGIAGSLGGVTAVAISGADETDQASVYREVCYCVTAPPSGAQTATMSWTQVGGNMILGVVSASGVDQTTPCTNGNGANAASGGPQAITITSTSGDLTTTIFGTTGGQLTDVTDQTLKWSGNGLYGDIGPGTGTTTHNWTGTMNFPSAAGANFKAAVGAGGGTAAPSLPVSIRRRRGL